MSIAKFMMALIIVACAVVAVLADKDDLENRVVSYIIGFAAAVALFVI